MEINVDAASPFVVKTQSVAKINISEITFAGYAECFRARIAEKARTGDDMQATKAFMRARRLKQVTAFTKANVIVALDHVAFANMPRVLFTRINTALDARGGTKGEILPGEGDGIYTPIIYKLGTPFHFTGDQISQKPIGTEQKIIELEFIAKTGGDIEEVLCHENSLDQTIALIRTCATPLGGETGLLRLPQTWLDTMTVADGFEIMAKVLPVFLE